MKRSARRTRHIIATALSVVLTATACGSDTSGTAPAADCAPSQGPVELTFWSWLPGVDKAVAAWNAANPDIQVRVEITPQGNQGTYGKMLTALKAGEAPDLGQVEFDNLPGFRVQQGLRDIAACPGVAEAGSTFVDWTWSQAGFQGDGVFAIPQDTGPLALYYRKDLFEKYGIAVPETWADYAAAARALTAADPRISITHFPQKDVNWFAGLVWQAGGRWFSLDSDAWSVTLADPGTRKVADYWQGLVDEGLVADLQGFSESWNKALDSGTVATWVSAAWGAGTLEAAAPSTTGKWAVAPLPQWAAGETRSGNWGGSTTAVLAGSEHPAEAAKFAVWLNSSPESLAILTSEGGIYPAAKDASATLAPTGKLSKFFGGQQYYGIFAESSAQVSQDFVWGPAMEQTYSHIRDGFGEALSDNGTLIDALAGAQQKTIVELERQSIPVRK